MAVDKTSFEQHLQKLKQDYSAQLPGKLEQIQSDWVKLSQAWDSELLIVLHRNIHSLIGTSGTFGFIEISKTARELETLIKPLKEQTNPDFTLDSTLPQAFSEVFSRLSSYVPASSPITPEPLPEPIAPLNAKVPANTTGKPEAPLSSGVVTDQKKRVQNTSIYYLDDDIAAPELLIQNLGSYGFIAKHFIKLHAFLEAIQESPPDLVILDLVLPEASEAEIFSLAKELKTRNISVIILSSRDDFNSRLEAVRSMVDAYILKPADVPALVSNIRTLLKLDFTSLPHVIIVDDQESVTQYYSLILERAGLRVTTLNDPLLLVQTLENTHTDLMLFDLNMPAVNGAELAAVIRQYEEYQSIPILFLSAETNLDNKTLLLRVGSDDMLPKDIPVDKFVSQVKSRIERSRKLTTLMYQDSLTGLLNHAQIQLAADRVFQHCKRKQTKCIFCMIDIDNFKQVNDSYGHMQGDKVIKALAQLLQQRLRSTDYIGRFGGEEFLLVLPEITISNAGKMLNALRKAFSQIKFHDDERTFTVTFSAGLAENTYMDDFMDQLQEADEALYRAKHRGRNVVCASLAGEGN